MATTLDEVMDLVYRYVDAACSYDFDKPETEVEADAALLSLRAGLAPIIADAQRYRSLQGKTDEQA